MLAYSGTRSLAVGLRRCGVLALVTLAFVSVVRAQPARAQSRAPATGDVPQAETPDAESAKPIEAPALLKPVEASYPPEAQARRLEARVVLALVIDAQGAVTEATVTEPAGHGFDEAALEAVRRFRFVPAKRAGQPMASRILYAYEFRLPPEAPGTPAEAPGT